MAILFAGLFARIMSFPLRHDEQMYLPAGALFAQGHLYRDFGFNSMPNLALLLHAVYSVSGTNHYLLAGRLLVFAAWLVTAAALALLVRRVTGSIGAAAVAVLILISNPLLLGPPGMLVTSNFMPVPFALLALYLFFAGTLRATPHGWLIAASGFCLALAVGFKANFVFMIPPFAVAAFAVPRDAGLTTQLRRVAMPLALGAVAGGVPVLTYFFEDPAGFLAHVLRYHRGPHIAYWTAHPVLEGPKIMTLAGKLQLAGGLWLGSATLIIVLAVLAFALVRRPAPGRAPAWPVVMTLGLVAGAMLVSFAPTPAFPQYYIAPLPFGLVLAASLYGRLDIERRVAARPFILAVTVLGVAIGAPRLLGDGAALADPAHWTGNKVHAAGDQIAAAIAAGHATGPMATLDPVYALEAGQRTYIALTTGVMVYRVGDLIPLDDRRYYRLVSPTTVSRLFDADPPAAILAGYEGDLDEPFVRYAQIHGYRPMPMAALRDRYGNGILYLRPADGR